MSENSVNKLEILYFLDLKLLLGSLLVFAEKCPFDKIVALLFRFFDANLDLSTTHPFSKVKKLNLVITSYVFKEGKDVKIGKEVKACEALPVAMFLQHMT